MFIREVKKQRSKSSGVFFQYNLVQAARVEGKVKQRIILYLGSDPLLRDKKNRKIVLDILKSKIFGQPDLFPANPPKNLADLSRSYFDKYLIKYEELAEGQQRVSVPPAPDKAEYHHIDIKGLEVSDVRTFGAEHLCRQMIDKLRLRECFASFGMTQKQTDKALIAIIARAIFSSSEHKTAQILEMNSELKGCFHYTSPITHKQLYNISDKLLSHKDEIDRFLYHRISSMFDIHDRLVIFDISNTYFETRKEHSKLARYGKSKEKRSDCPLVVFTGVIDAQGFIRHSRVYEGNKPDMQTLSDMLSDLEKHCRNNTKKTVVMDAGIATEDNLALLREKNYDYVCVSRKRIEDYPATKTGKTIRMTDRDKNKVELLVFNPKDFPDTWMYVESDAKRCKEQSINHKLTARYEEDLHTISEALSKKHGIKKTEKVWERIGRAKERHKKISARYDITLSEKDGIVTHIQWKQKPSQVKTDKEKGVYFIRTSYVKPTEDQLWDVYNIIREVESTFRCLKSDIRIRPVYHQKDHRIEGHIYLTLLAYQVVNAIRHMLWANQYSLRLEKHPPHYVNTNHPNRGATNRQKTYPSTKTLQTHQRSTRNLQSHRL